MTHPHVENENQAFFNEGNAHAEVNLHGSFSNRKGQRLRCHLEELVVGTNKECVTSGVEIEHPSE